MAKRIETPFDKQTTALEVVNGLQLAGKRALVTGGSSGIGTETVRALAAAGADVGFTARSPEAAAKTAQDVRQSTGNPNVSGAVLDLTDGQAVDAFTRAWQGPLHILVNNAGATYPDRRLSKDGYELQFATNHLGHFRLTLGLHTALRAAGGARIVSVSSRGHLYSPIVFEDINFEARDYNPVLAYAQSKTANVLFAVGITRRWADDKITANAVHPGDITSTSLARAMDPEIVRQMVEQASLAYTKTAGQGAATSLLAAVWPALEGVSGRYFEDCAEASVVSPQNSAEPLDSGVADYALDTANAERLWALSERALDGD